MRQWWNWYTQVSCKHSASRLYGFDSRLAHVLDLLKSNGMVHLKTKAVNMAACINMCRTLFPALDNPKAGV